MQKTQRKRRHPKQGLEGYVEKLKSLKASVSTSLGAVNLILLGGMGEVKEEQKRFLSIAKKHLEMLFVDIQKFIESLEAPPRS